MTAFLLLVAPVAHATLGESSESVLKNQKALTAELKKTAHDGYDDYSLSLPDGGTVHQFVNRSNQVFEITWVKRGSRPDMNLLLGTYFSRLTGQINSGKPTARHADRTESDFVLHSRLINRFFSGTAYIPDQIPANLEGPIHLPVEQAR